MSLTERNIRCSQPPLSLYLIDLLDQLQAATSTEDILQSLADFPLHQNCDMISLRFIQLNGGGIPLLTADTFWHKPGGSTLGLDEDVRVDEDSLTNLWILTGGEPMFLRDVQDFALFTDTLLRNYYQQGIRSLYRILLTRDENPFAMVTVLWKTSQDFSDDVEAAAHCLGWLLAPQIENLMLKREIIALRQQIQGLEQNQQEMEIGLYSLVHDLKTPIASLVATTSLLDNYLDRLSAGEISQRLQRISAESFRMSDWVQSILFLVKTRSTEQVNLEQVDARLQLYRTVDALQQLFEEHQASITYATLPESFPLVYGVEVWVEHIWGNLISNAIKYGGTEPHVTIRADVQDAMVRFQVSDQGMGIQQEQLELIFQPFYRILQQTKGIRGTGIGLATAKLLVEKMGGKIGVESLPGAGSTFWFTLPLLRAKTNGDDLEDLAC
ncbi:MAG: HAMP domain-containing histidine kinase [Anaerolineae bacterium]|nr:HAMP domain-containing histidine kinase [Anaerolineae bacterium]